MEIEPLPAPGQGPRRTLAPAPWLLAGWAAALVAALAGAFVWLPARLAPDEDAAILFRYSENLARTGTIAFSPGGPRSEGATDFLWMVALAALHRAGVPTYPAALALSVLGLVATALAALRLSGRRDPRLFLGVLTLLLLCPMLMAGVGGFAVLVFGAALSGAIACAVEGRSRALYLACLATSLLRPDGALLVAPLVALDLLRPDRAGRLRRVGECLLWLAIPGLSYFAWRWSYFGQALPLPFYVKALRGHRVAGVVVGDSLLLNLRVALSLLPLWAAALWRRPQALARSAAPLALGAAAFALYSVVMNEQNVALRFQYPLVVAGVAAAAIALRREGDGRRLALGAALTALLWLPGSAATLVATLATTDEQPIVTVSKALARLPPGTLATTEAGRLGYLSGWPTRDLWGLNDPVLAHRLVTPADLRAWRPDLVVLHSIGEAYAFLDAPPPSVETERTWEGMNANAMRGLDDDYAIALVPFESERAAAAAPLVARLRRLDPFETLLRGAMRAYHALRGASPSSRAAYEEFLNAQGHHFRRYDLFAVRRGYAGRPQLEAVLAGVGALAYPEYRARKQADQAQRADEVPAAR